MHPMPREGTETVFPRYVYPLLSQCILCPVRGRKPRAKWDREYEQTNASYAP